MASHYLMTLPREQQREYVRVFFGDRLFRCPTTGRVVEGFEGDDKLLCRCGRSNPRIPDERTEQTGTHIVRFLDRATPDEYLDQIAADAAAKS